MPAVRLRAHGQVQGVGYRAHVVEAARTAGAAGWVRNRDDGSVEAHVEGDEEAVRDVLAACETGPPAAMVERVTREDVEPEGLGGFEQR